MAWFATDLFFQHLTMCISDVKHFILLFVLWKRYKRCRIICRFTITSNSDECLDSSNAFSLLLSSTRLLIYKYFLFTMPIAVSNAMGVGSILLQLFIQRTITYFIKYNKIPTWLILVCLKIVCRKLHCTYLQDTKQNKQAKPDLAVQSMLRVDCITIVHRKLHCGFMRLHQNNRMKQNQTWQFFCMQSITLLSSSWMVVASDWLHHLHTDKYMRIC